MESPRPNLDQYYLAMLEVVKLRATCPRRQVGCILVDADGRVLATGYNGVPRSQDHCINPLTRCDGFQDASGNSVRCMAIHAEQNAMMQCLDLDRVSVVYCSASPCLACTKTLFNLRNLKRVVFTELYPDNAALKMWKPVDKLRWINQRGETQRLHPSVEGLVWYA